MTTSSPLCLRFLFIILAVVILVAVGQSAGSVHAATLNVDQNDPACPGPSTAPYCTIGAAVADADAGDTIKVFPGAYAENVALASMNTPGDITLLAVDASGTPTPGTVTVNPAGGEPFSAVCLFPGSITIDGFVVLSPDQDGMELCANGDLIVKNVTANANGDTGVHLDGNANVTVMDTTANANGLDGFDIHAHVGVSISGSTANQNQDNDGFDIDAGGTVTVSDSFANSNVDDGFKIETVGNVTVTGSTANDNSGGDGFDVDHAADVSVSGSTANGNGDDDEEDHGFDIDASGPVTVSGSVGNNNAGSGFSIEIASQLNGPAIASAVSVPGAITVTDSTANNNGDEGFLLRTNTTASVDRVTAMGNGDDGVDIEGPQVVPNGAAALNAILIDTLSSSSVVNSHLQGNSGSGIDYDGFLDETPGNHVVDSSIICENTDSGMLVTTENDPPMTAEGNWWGAASGPTHPSNAGGTGDLIQDTPAGGSGDVDFEPWIDTITGSAGAATVGQPVVVTFQFTGAPPAVLLSRGPGDPNGEAPFSAETDNGTATTSGFIDNDKLEITLTPAKVGEATVTVTGPCGLDDTAGGNSVVLDVAAAPVEATPTPTPAPTPVELPPSGGQPADGSSSSFLWLLLVVGGIVVLSGVLVLARQVRRIR